MGVQPRHDRGIARQAFSPRSFAAIVQRTVEQSRPSSSFWLLFVSGIVAGVLGNEARHHEWDFARRDKVHQSITALTAMDAVSGRLRANAAEPPRLDTDTLDASDLGGAPSATASIEVFRAENVEPANPTSDSGESRLRNAAEFGQTVAVSVRAGRSFGAGVLVGPDRILTAMHVVAHDDQGIEVRFHDEGWQAATLIEADPDIDLAVLAVRSGAHPVASETSEGVLHVGDTLWGVGNPRELGFTAYRGIVSYVGRRFGSTRYIQTDLPANPGSSGGPVLDDRGALVGVMSSVLRESEGIAFVTPIGDAEALLKRAGL